MRRFKHNSTLRHVFYGLPGTGKTFRLFQIAINHAIEGQKVLFCCYNTVLAADIKRLIQLTHIAREEANKISDFLPNITVTTISSLLKTVAKTLNVIEEIPPEEESQAPTAEMEKLLAQKNNKLRGLQKELPEAEGWKKEVAKPIAGLLFPC